MPQWTPWSTNEACLHFNAPLYPRCGIAPLSEGVPEPATAEVTVELDVSDVVVRNGLITDRFGPDGLICSMGWGWRG